MLKLPPKVRSFAEAMLSPKFGSERFIAELVVNNRQGLVLTFCWLTDLSESVDCDAKAKSPEVRKAARIALRDLAEVVIEGSKTSLELRGIRSEAKKLVAEKLLADLNLIAF
jgi:hypothetical protein